MFPLPLGPDSNPQRKTANQNYNINKALDISLWATAKMDKDKKTCPQKRAAINEHDANRRCRRCKCLSPISASQLFDLSCFDINLNQTPVARANNDRSGIHDRIIMSSACDSKSIMHPTSRVKRLWQPEMVGGGLTE
eukprot:scaffold143928_cov31-Prasinocladus_malaysianus.AAC.1